MRSIVLTLAAAVLALSLPAVTVNAEELEPAAAEESIYDIGMLQSGNFGSEQAVTIPETEASGLQSSSGREARCRASEIR